MVKNLGWEHHFRCMLCWKNLSVEYSTLKREAIFGRFFFPFIFAILKCVFLSGLSITFYKLPCCVFFFFLSPGTSAKVIIVLMYLLLTKQAAFDAFPSEV